MESRVQGKERTMLPHLEQIEEKGRSSMAEPLSGMALGSIPSLGTKDKRRETEGKEVLHLAAWDGRMLA